jgi:hypothetical protein
MSIRLFNPSGGFIDLNAGGDGTAANTFTLPAETGTLLTSASNIETQVKTATNASGSAPIYSCRAWVNFNGTGTPAIRASGNVSSITDSGTGVYKVNFTTALSDINYSVVGTSGGTGDETGDTGRTLMTCNNSSVNFTAVFTKNSSTGTLDDYNTNSVAVFR